MEKENKTLEKTLNRKEVRLNSGKADEISVRKYNTIMMLTLMYGFFMNAIMVSCFSDTFRAFVSDSYRVFYVIYLVSGISGIVLAFKSDNPYVSFLGYNMLVLPLGLLLCLTLPGIPSEIITQAMLETGLITVLMLALSYIFPDFFLGLGRALFISLLLAMIVEFVGVVCLDFATEFLDIIFVLIFSGYIGYDFSKSQS